MKNRKFLDLFNLADDKYITESDPSRPLPKRKRFNLTAILASVCCLLLILNLTLLIPLLIKRDGGGISEVADSTQNTNLNYIKNPSSVTDSDNKNNVNLVGNNEVIKVLETLFNSPTTPGSTPGINDSVENESNKDETLEEAEDSILGDLSADINDNQVEGISEGDIAKKSDKFVYYLHNYSLYVYSINKSKSKLECMLPLTGYTENLTSYFEELNINRDKMEETECNWEMFLSSDYSTLTIIIKSSFIPLTALVNFDVSHSPTVELKDFKIISGDYVSSRVVNGEMLLFTSYRIYSGFDKENPLTYMPFFTTQEATYLAQNIYFPSIISNSDYIMVTRLDSKGLTVKESSAYLSYSDDLYVSENNIFLTRNFNENGPKTEIAVIGYGSALFQNKGTVKINGYLKDQYSLDEYKGILRAVTTSYTERDRSSASLFLIDLNKMEIVSSVLNFAPEGETVRSVRFDKEYAYVCTAVLLTDPVFFFNLSDVNNITYTDTGNIVGFSSSLINLGNGYVVGIGVGSSSNTLKIEVYTEENESVESVCAFESPLTYYPDEYKSYYIDRENQLIGIPIRVYTDGLYSNRYLLLKFTGETLETVLNQGISTDSKSRVRGFLQDKYYYVVSSGGIYAFDISESIVFPKDSTSSTEPEDYIPTRDPSLPAW